MHAVYHPYSLHSFINKQTTVVAPLQTTLFAATAPGHLWLSLAFTTLPSNPSSMLARRCSTVATPKGFNQHVCGFSAQNWLPQRRPLPCRRVEASASGRDGGLPVPSVLGDLDMDMQWQFSEMQRSFQQMEQEVNGEVGRMLERSRQLQERAATQGFVAGKDGSQTYRNEQRFEERLPHGYRQAWRSESVTYYGAAPSYAQLPQQHWGLTGGVLFAAAALLGVWAAVSAALRRNFHRTRYDGSRMWLVLLLWPFLALLSDSFRRELRGALGGQGTPPSKGAQG